MITAEDEAAFAANHHNAHAKLREVLAQYFAYAPLSWDRRRAAKTIITAAAEVLKSQVSWEKADPTFAALGFSESFRRDYGAWFTEQKIALPQWAEAPHHHARAIVTTAPALFDAA